MYPAVYSYKRVKTRELELSIESLKNIKEWNGQIIVIGDKPELEADHTHLPIKYDWGKTSGNRHNDEICAYLTARDVLGDFIALADDHVILKPWKLTRHHREPLSKHIKGRANPDSYTRSLKRTKDLLTRLGKPTLSYELHIPFLMKAEELTEIEPLLPQTKHGVLIRSMLGNYFATPSTFLEDNKNKPLDDDAVIYSGSDKTFNYSLVKKYLCH